MLFNKIYDKIKLTTRSVQSQKQMIQDVGNVELFELLETDPKTQCKACPSYWSEGIVYCTCGHLLKETVANRSFKENTLDLLSNPEHVIKKGRPHGHRKGKLPENKEHHLAHNFKKRCIKKKLLRDRIFRGRMIENSHDEEVCRAWDVLANENHTYHVSKKILFGGSFSTSREITSRTLRKRFDFKQALSTLKRLHQEVGKRQFMPMPFWKYQQRA